jgi:Protein of unknown function (DUF3147)
MVLEYFAKFVAGGLLVCIFALISQVCMPKQFAGIFSTAPSVLLAGLAVTLLTKGATQAMLTAEGAIAGAIGMIFYCVVATPMIKRYQALVGSILSLSVWFLVSFCAFALMYVALRW